MKRLLTIAMVLLLMTGCSSAGVSQKIASISAADAAALVEQNSDADSFVILDIRTPEEYAAGKLDGAINIDFYANDFRSRIDQLDKDTHYLVYCRSGNRSGQALPIFEDLGFTRVDNLANGIVDWFEQGYPVVP